MPSFVIPIIIIGILGICLGAIIGLVVHFFAEPADEKLEKILDTLPGANCGGCGFAGCADFGRSLMTGSATPIQCVAASAKVIVDLAEILDVQTEAREDLVAFIRCRGNVENSQEFNYNGIADCRAANYVAGGFKSCKQGCLRFGSCTHACPFKAIKINEQGLPIVDKKKCVGCRKCSEICPRDLIAFVPRDAKVHVLCNNPMRGPDKIKACKLACIGCRKCDKLSPETMLFNGAVASIDYSKPPKTPEEIEQLINCCPVHCILGEKE